MSGDAHGASEIKCNKIKMNSNGFFFHSLLKQLYVSLIFYVKYVRHFSQITHLRPQSLTLPTAVEALVILPPSCPTRCALLSLCLTSVNQAMIQWRERGLPCPALRV